MANQINVIEEGRDSIIVYTSGPQGPPGEVGSVNITSDTLVITGDPIDQDNPEGTFTVDAPQAIDDEAEPTFAGLTLTGLTANAFLYSDSSKSIAASAAPTNGQVLIGSTGSAPVLAALTAGTAISVTNGAGTITIANTGVTSVAGTTNQVVASGSTGAITLSLPQSIHTSATPTFGGLTVGGGSSQYSARISARGSVTGSAVFEWGHNNTSGYGNSLGFDVTSGHGWLAFFASRGTTADTYKTWGNAGGLIKHNTSGQTIIAALTNASADDQTPTNIAMFSTAEIQLDATTLDINGNIDADGTTYDFDAATTLSLHGGSADITLSGTEVDLTATTLDFNGTADISGALTVGSAGGTSNPLRLVGNDTTGDCYVGFFEDDNTTRKGYFGYGNVGDDTFYIANEESGSVLIQTAATTRLTVGSTGTVTLASGTSLTVPSGFTVTTGGGTLTFAGTSETMATMADDGAVVLYYDNSAKLDTKTDGVNVVGELEADSLDIDGNADISGTLGVTGITTFSARTLRAVAAAVSAAGTDQAGATALTAEINNVTTVASGAGVRLTESVGTKFVVRNAGANALNVYPPSGDAIDGLGTNNPLVLSVGANATFVCITNALFFTINATYA
jgi:hypothetical protein